MLDNLIAKFRDAEGRSEFVIVVVCDIRNFSGFSAGRQAPEIAIFISRFYEKLLSEYFTNAVFAKPTGDGLIMIFKHSKSDLPSVAESVLGQCDMAIKKYPVMFSDDLMINFPLPEKIGFGVARGTAFCLFSGEDLIDYSGQVLNLAARLNDMAKPGGIVIDEAFLWDAIPKALHPTYRSEMVYIRGIAEDLPRKVFCSTEVKISESAKYPINSHTWDKASVTNTYKQIKSVKGSFSIEMPVEPLSRDLCKLKISWSSVVSPGHVSSFEVTDFTIEKDAEGVKVMFNLGKEKERFKDQKLRNESTITMTVHFVPKPTVEMSTPVKAAPVKAARVRITK